MRVGVNCLVLSKNYTGLGVYAVNILNKIIENSAFEIVLFTAFPDDIEELIKGNYRIERMELSGSKLARLYSEQILLPRRAEALGIDVLFSPIFYMPLFIKCYSFLTVHDVIHKTYPKDMKLRNRLLMNLFLNSAIRKADRIVTVSENTKKDLKEIFDRKDKVHVVYEGLGDETTTEYIKPDMIEEEDRFAIIVGSTMPRKNVLGMIKAYDRVRDKKGLKLVIAGSRGYRYQEIDAYLRDNHVKGVIMTGYLKNEEINWLYRHAKMLLFCSFYEGFGLPLLEAMRYGVPVIASNTSSIPEVVGDAAVLVDPYNIDSITEAIEAMNKEDEYRDRYRVLGYERVQYFSWDKAANEMISIFKMIEKELNYEDRN